MSKLFISSPAAMAGARSSYYYEKEAVISPAAIIFILIFLMGAFCKAQSPEQLTPPLLKYLSVFFKNRESVELKFAREGTQIHYTLNKKEAAGLDMVYIKPIQIKKSFTTIKHSYQVRFFAI